MKKITKRNQQALKNIKAFQSIDRKLMPRPAVFKDKTKYNRKAMKQNALRYDY